MSELAYRRRYAYFPPSMKPVEGWNGFVPTKRIMSLFRLRRLFWRGLTKEQRDRIKCFSEVIAVEDETIEFRKYKPL